jgi:hypothetical protein
MYFYIHVYVHIHLQIYTHIYVYSYICLLIDYVYHSKLKEIRSKNKPSMHTYLLSIFTLIHMCVIIHTFDPIYRRKKTENNRKLTQKNAMMNTYIKLKKFSQKMHPN